MYVYVCLCEFVCTGNVKAHMEVREVLEPLKLEFVSHPVRAMEAELECSPGTVPAVNPGVTSAAAG